jgi:hypothetical protein
MYILVVLQLLAYNENILVVHPIATSENLTIEQCQSKALEIKSRVDTSTLILQCVKKINKV